MTPTNEAGHGLPELPRATDLMPEAWTNDCQGKQDFDSDLMALSCRYYPPNYRADGKHSVNASIVWGVGIGAPIAEREFAADNESMVKAAAEDWARVEVSKVIKAAAGTHGNGDTGRPGMSYWAVELPGKMPKLYGAYAFAELNWYPDEGGALVRLQEVERIGDSTTPQPAAADGVQGEVQE